LLFTATKNADQPLAVWRMIQKVAYSTAKNGFASKPNAQQQSRMQDL